MVSEITLVDTCTSHRSLVVDSGADSSFSRYGVREHALGAAMNGIAAYGPNLMIPAGGTFLFSLSRTLANDFE